MLQEEGVRHGECGETYEGGTHGLGSDLLSTSLSEPDAKKRDEDQSEAGVEEDNQAPAPPRRQ